MVSRSHPRSASSNRSSPSALYYAVPITSAVGNVRRSDFLSVQGYRLFALFSLFFTIGALLIRDASLLSFILYVTLVILSLFFIIVKMEPFAISLLIETKSSNAKIVTPKGPPSSTAVAITKTSSSSSSSSSSTVLKKNNNRVPINLLAVDESQIEVPRPFALIESPSAASPSSSSFSTGRSSSVSVSAVAPSISHAPATAISILSNHSPPGAKEMISPPSPITCSIPPIIDTPLSNDIPSDDLDSPSSSIVSNEGSKAELISSSSSSSSSSSLTIPSSLPPPSTLIPLGCTLEYSSSGEEGKWSELNGETFQVRIGPNYKRNKQKSSSGPSMLRCIGADIFKSPCKVLDLAKRIRLPKFRILDENGKVIEIINHTPTNPFHISSSPIDLSELVIDDEPGLGGVPPFWLINFQIPTYDHSYLWTKEDGDEVMIVMYYTLTDEARESLKNDSTASARLLKEFVANIHDVRWHNRFKCIPRVCNADECTLPAAPKKLLKTYNAKPFLTGPLAHYFSKSSCCMQVDIDVHRFCFVARKAAYGFLSDVRSMNIDVAFVVEGHSDDELPEQVLATVKINKVDTAIALTLEEWVEKLKKSS